MKRRSRIRKNKIFIFGNFDNLLSEKDRIIFFFRKTVNMFMKHGNRDMIDRVFRIVCFELTKKYKFEDIFSFIAEFRDKIIPLMCVHSRRIGKKGRIVYIPCLVHYLRACGLGIRWFAEAVNERREFGLVQRVLFEIDDVMSNRGLTMSKKKSYYDLIIANRPNIKGRSGRKLLWFFLKKLKRRMSAKRGYGSYYKLKLIYGTYSRNKLNRDFLLRSFISFYTKRRFSLTIFFLINCIIKNYCVTDDSVVTSTVNLNRKLHNILNEHVI